MSCSTRLSRLSFEEAKKWYAIYGAQDNVGFLVGPGWRSMPLVSREAVYRWMIRWIKNSRVNFHEQPVRLYTENELRVTPSGNVEEEAGSRKHYQLLVADFHAKQHRGTIPELTAKLRDFRIPTDGSAPGNGGPAGHVDGSNQLDAPNCCSRAALSISVRARRLYRSGQRTE
jgi:hypothetical protein